MTSFGRLYDQGGRKLLAGLAPGPFFCLRFYTFTKASMRTFKTMTGNMDGDSCLPHRHARQSWWNISAGCACAGPSAHDQGASRIPSSLSSAPSSGFRSHHHHGPVSYWARQRTLMAYAKAPHPPRAPAGVAATSTNQVATTLRVASGTRPIAFTARRLQKRFTSTMPKFSASARRASSSSERPPRSLRGALAARRRRGRSGASWAARAEGSSPADQA